MGGLLDPAGKWMSDQNTYKRVYDGFTVLEASLFLGCGDTEQHGRVCHSKGAQFTEARESMSLFSGSLPPFYSIWPLAYWLTVPAKPLPSTPRGMIG